MTVAWTGAWTANNEVLIARFSLKIGILAFQHLRLRCNYFLCLLITALCYYDGGSLASCFRWGAASVHGLWHGQGHGQPIKRGIVAAFLLKISILAIQPSRLDCNYFFAF